MKIEKLKDKVIETLKKDFQNHSFIFSQDSEASERYLFSVSVFDVETKENQDFECFMFFSKVRQNLEIHLCGSDFKNYCIYL